MSEILVESITKYIRPNKEIKITIWRKELILTRENNYDLIDFINNYFQKYPIWYPEKMGEAILELDKVTKVEILDKNDCGIVLTKF